jgi:hypothetical protein
LNFRVTKLEFFSYRRKGIGFFRSLHKCTLNFVNHYRIPET